MKIVKGGTFNGWRGKIGGLALILALIPMVGWVRSRFVSDYIIFQSGEHTIELLSSSKKDGICWESRHVEVSPMATGTLHFRSGIPHTEVLAWAVPESEIQDILNEDEPFLTRTFVLSESEAHKLLNENAPSGMGKTSTLVALNIPSPFQSDGEMFLPPVENESFQKAISEAAEEFHDATKWKWRWCGFCVGGSEPVDGEWFTIVAAPYWSFVSPLCLLWGYLLLNKSRSVEVKKQAETAPSI